MDLGLTLVKLNKNALAEKWGRFLLCEVLLVKYFLWLTNEKLTNH
jgi:hypothetical protein